MADILGNTYPVKDHLKAIGARWNAERKVWTISDDKLEQAKSIVTNAPKPTYRPSKCKECGARPGPRGWPRIYRNGICSDCYRDREEDY